VPVAYGGAFGEFPKIDQCDVRCPTIALSGVAI
jgi:hypothetical protein